MGKPMKHASASRLDRELNELLQELRVIQGGILLLVGFLLVIAFSAAFSGVSDFQKLTYYATLLVTGVAAIIVVAPVVHHRMAFRKHDKERVVLRGNHQVLTSIVLVALSILGILTLITDYLYGTTATIVIDLLYVGLVTLMWVVLPLHSLRLARLEHEAEVAAARARQEAKQARRDAATPPAP